jgi:LmbE family N-acetylglucosaminyl deacetylase
MLNAILSDPLAPLRILCLGAHADDIEIGCGGTVLRFVAEHPDASFGWVVFSGSGPRAGEAEASAAAFLAGCPDRQISILNFKDGYFPSQGAEIKDTFERLKSRFTPTLIFTHFKKDAHQDHRVIAELTYNTFRDHLILEYEVPKYDGDLGNPNLFTTLSAAQAEKKIAALMEYFSTQRSHSWFNAETFQAMLRLRGTFSKTATGLAEGFYCRKMVI